MHPPAEVEPASVRMFEHFWSFSIMLKMPAAREVSREVNDILPMESMMGRASNEVMSICSTGVDSSIALVLEPGLAFGIFLVDFFALGAAMGRASSPTVV